MSTDTNEPIKTSLTVYVINFHPDRLLNPSAWFLLPSYRLKLLRKTTERNIVCAGLLAYFCHIFSKL